MKRLACLLALSVALLCATFWMDRRRAALRATTATVRPLLPLPPFEAGGVREVRLRREDRVVRYVRSEGSWSCPDYHGAPGREDRLSRLVGTVLEATATPETEGGWRLSRDPAVLALLDGRDSLILRLHEDVPGPREERFVQVAGADTLYQMHADPLGPFEGWANPVPPLLDRRVFPAAISRREPVAVAVSGAFTLLRRSRPSPPTPGAPPFSWSFEAAPHDPVDPAAAGRFLSRLTGLRWQEILEDPFPGPPDGRLRLYDASGAVDTLDVWLREEGPLVRNRTTGFRFRVEPGGTPGLLPDRSFFAEKK